jgi:hypothetical protein
MTFFFFGQKYFRYLKWRYPDKFKIQSLSQYEIYKCEIKYLILERKKTFLKLIETQSPFSRNIDKIISKRLKYF